MTIRELVELHGIPIKVKCTLNGYPAFTIISEDNEKSHVSEIPALDDYEAIL